LFVVNAASAVANGKSDGRKSSRPAHALSLSRDQGAAANEEIHQ
jgi:hypothetical protein